jgi:nitroreductase
MTLKKTAETAVPILPALAERWSPRAYEASHSLSKDELTAVLEAARWAPSANNGQPWRFSVLERGSELHRLVSEQLTGFNQAWAPNASHLVVVSTLTKRADGEPYRSAHFDAGLAVQSMAVQAEALGLAAHVMAGADREEIHRILGLNGELEVLVLVTVGKAADPSTLEGPAHEREVAPRTRLALSEIVLHGKP